MSTTLTTPPVSTLVASLFADAARTDAPLREKLRAMSPEARAALMSGAKTDYRAFYGNVGAHYLPVSPETGTLLYILARARNARTIVEFGTSFGISTLHLAAALKDNGGGRLIGSEFEAEKVRVARENVANAGLASYVEIREGDALGTLARDLPPAIDLVLLDGAKMLYSRILALLEPRLAPGALIVADNADDSPDYLAHVRAIENGYLSVPFGADVELTMSTKVRT